MNVALVALLLLVPFARGSTSEVGPGRVQGFLENRGQWRESVRYRSWVAADAIWFERGAFSVGRWPSRTCGGVGASLRFSFVGTNSVEPVGSELLSGKHHFFRGNNPDDWVRDVGWYRSIEYQSVVPGIDVIIRPATTCFEYDLVVENGARLADLQIRCEGAASVAITGNGDLALSVGSFELIQPVPRAYCIDAAGHRQEVAAEFVLFGKSRFGFRTAAIPRGSSLVIDPGLVWSSYFGGSQVAASATAGQANVENISIGVDGSVTIFGETGLLDLPVTPGAYEECYLGGFDDLFVARFDPRGDVLEYCTYLGDTTLYDGGFAVTSLDDGSVILAGCTWAKGDFPVTPGALAIGKSNSNFEDLAFVVRLNPTGSDLVFSAVFGGFTGNTRASAVAYTPGIGITVKGLTSATDFPTTTGAYQAKHGGALTDLFITRISDDGSAILASTFFGRTDDEFDQNHRIHVDPDGSVVFSEYTIGTDVPVTPGAFLTTSSASIAGYLAKLDPSFAALDFCTFLNTTDQVRPRSVERHPKGWITFFGDGKGYPTTPGTVTSFAQGTSLLVGNFSPDGSTMLQGLAIGTPDLDEGGQMAIDGAGNIIISGNVSNGFYPSTPGAFDETHNQSHSVAVVSKLDPTLSELLYSTYFGGMTNPDGGPSHTGLPRIYLDVEGNGDAAIAGHTTAVDLPTTPSSFMPDYPGLPSASFVAKFDLLPRGVRRVGEATWGCDGPPGITVSKMPSFGATDFRITGFHAPPSSFGLLMASPGVLTQPVNVSGAAFWLNATVLIAAPVAADEIGVTEVPVGTALSVTPVGSQGALQFFWPDPCAAGGVSSSAALLITVQP